MLVCPVCGRRRHPSHSVCKDCSTEFWGLKCPDCGGRKSRNSKRCASCSFIAEKDVHVSGWRKPEGLPDFSLIPENWWYQFVGFFCSEGTANIKETNKGSYAVHLNLVLREDDGAAIREVHQKLGGSVRRDAHIAGANATLRWELGQIHQVQEACHQILAHELYQFKKLNDVRVVLQFCDWRLSQPWAGADMQVAKAFRDKLVSLRGFKVQD